MYARLNIMGRSKTSGFKRANPSRSRTQAVLPSGPRLSDYLIIGALAQVYPIGSIPEALASCGRQRNLPAETMVQIKWQVLCS